MSDNIETERHVLGGIITYPNILAECAEYLNEDLFFDKEGVHKIIFRVIKNFYKEGRELNTVNIAKSVAAHGVSFEEMSDVDLRGYISTLNHLRFSKQATTDAIIDLHKDQKLRDMWRACSKAQEYIKSNRDHTLDEIVSKYTKITSDSTSFFSPNGEPEDVTKDIAEIIAERLNNPIEHIGLESPFPLFNAQFGGFRSGNVYAFVARPKHGKTTFLTWIAAEMARINSCKVLYLDTEMEIQDLKFRNISAYSGISPYDIETGNIKEGEKPLLRDAVRKYKQDLQGKFFHLHCPQFTIEKIINTVKRWIFKNIKQDEKFLVVYDYIKLTGEKTSDHQKEYQLIGEKVNALKELSTLYQFPLLTACQLNRDAENGRDDSGAIAASDRLQWFASFVAIFRRRRAEEYTEYGDVKTCGTHSLIALATRFQGPKAKGHDMTTIMPSGSDGGREKPVPYFINYDVRNFRVTEKMDSDTVAERLRLGEDLNNDWSENEQQNEGF